MTTHHLMPKNDGFPLLSRDWTSIECGARSCVYRHPCGWCIAPSRATIGEDGRCKGFKIEDKIEDKNEKVNSD